MKKHFVSLMMVVLVAMLSGCATMDMGGGYYPAPIQVQPQVRPVVIAPMPVVLPPVAVSYNQFGYGSRYGDYLLRDQLNFQRQQQRDQQNYQHQLQLDAQNWARQQQRDAQNWARQQQRDRMNWLHRQPQPRGGYHYR